MIGYGLIKEKRVIKEVTAEVLQHKKNSKDDIKI
jgi:hypothetical protein